MPHDSVIAGFWIVSMNLEHLYPCCLADSLRLKCTSSESALFCTWSLQASQCWSINSSDASSSFSDCHLASHQQLKFLLLTRSWTCHAVQRSSFHFGMSAGAGCVKDSCSTSSWQAVGLTSRGSPTLVITAASCCQCISWRDVLWHRSSLLPPKTETKEDHTPDRKPRTQQRKQRREREANQRVARVARYDKPVMGLPCGPFVLFVFFLGGGVGGVIGHVS